MAIVLSGLGLVFYNLTVGLKPKFSTLQNKADAPVFKLVLLSWGIL